MHNLLYMAHIWTGGYFPQKLHLPGCHFFSSPGVRRKRRLNVDSGRNVCSLISFQSLHLFLIIINISLWLLLSHTTELPLPHCTSSSRLLYLLPKGASNEAYFVILRHSTFNFVPFKSENIIIMLKCNECRNVGMEYGSGGPLNQMHERNVK